MAASSTFLRISLSLSSLVLVLLLLLLLTFSTTSSAHGINLNTKGTPSFSNPGQRAEVLIRSLNLFPKESVNIDSNSDDDSLNSTPSLVEKRFHFPSLDSLSSSSPSVQELGHHAGYFRLPHTKAARMFYFFFESRKSKNAPVVIWLTGGPGCSSDMALFYENGPFKITKNLSLVWNDYGWDQASNIIFVDQPTGTGFSYSTDEGDLRHDEAGVSNDLYDFIQAFYKAHPEYVMNDFYITGESYAGHYVPAFAGRVHQGNKANEGIHINLKGFAIGNGLTNPEIQYQAYTQYALDMKVITQADKDEIDQLYPHCKELIESCGLSSDTDCEDAYSHCNRIFNNIMSIAGDINYYDIRKQCERSLCYDFSNMEIFLNENSVRDALGVGNITFVSCSTEVYNAMVRDWMRNLETGIPQLLEDGIRVLVYAGEYDLICNWLGNSNWVHAMKWSGQNAFTTSPTTPFMVDNNEAGLLKSHGPLAFVKVHNAGHMVPMDQPKAALQMLEMWMQGKIGMVGRGSDIAPK